MATSICSLSEYRRIVSALPRPPSEQVDDFVKFVSDAHSWYKHLPLLPPGVPFFFFLDPLSGYDTVHRPDGSVVHEERTENSQPFHYTWMLTRTYRTRFGHLSYATNAGMMFMLRTSEAMHEYANLPEFSTVEASFRLPPEVAAAGSVKLTGVISYLAPRVVVWRHFLPDYIARHPNDPPRQWPEETGGEPTLRKILKVCEGMMRCPGEPGSEAGMADPDKIEAELKALLKPEKERLQAGMTEAINRMLDLLYPPHTI